MDNSPFAALAVLTKYQPFIELAEQADLEALQKQNQIEHSWFLHNQQKATES